MKILILGCNGMAGHTISLYMKEKGHYIYGIDINESQIIPSFALDVHDCSKLREIVGRNKYDSIINCIGILNMNAEIHKESAVYLNSYLPHLLANLTEGTETQVIQLSTDSIYSGTRGEYTENDIPDGVTFYDRTKAIGELNDMKNITLRNSIVGPDINPNGIGLLNWFMKQSGQIQGYVNAIWTGQTTLQLAKTMENAAQEKAHGLYNTVPDYSISKYELLKLFSKYLRRNSTQIIPNYSLSTNKSLKRIKYDFNYIIPDYEKMVYEMALWIFAHKDMYPHYNTEP